MAGLQERLKQLGEKQKGKDGEKAAEQKRGERKSEIGEALAGAETARAEAESGANDARTALADADRFVQEHPDGIDPEVADELAALRTEAEATIKKFEDLSGQVDALRAELAALESGEAETPTASEQPAADVVAEPTVDGEEGTEPTLEEKVRGIVAALKEVPEKVKNASLKRELTRAVELIEEDPQGWAHYLNVFVREPGIDDYVSESSLQAKETAKELSDPASINREYGRRAEAEKPAPIKKEEELRKRGVEKFGPSYDFYQDRDLSELNSDHRFTLDEPLRQAILADRAELFTAFTGKTPEQFDKERPAPKSMREVFVETPVTEISILDQKDGYRKVGKRPMMEQWKQRRDEIYTATDKDIKERRGAALAEYQTAVEHAKQTPDYISDAAVIKANQTQYGEEVKKVIDLQARLREQQREQQAAAA